MRKEFRHPVLEMMGISRLRVPSRNWLIFWGVTGSLVSAYYWDRRERKKVRDYWVGRVAVLGEQPIGPYDLPRKLKVYVAPPPNDYIDAGLSHFRNFIKPVFTSAAVDHELISAERQGYIRSRVAEEVREIRRNRTKKDENSKWNADLTGGVVIVGRGAYKEYMAGLQEGWFGPLNRPDFVQNQIDEEAAEEKARLAKRREEKASATDGERQVDYDNEEDWETDRKASLARKYPVIPPYISISEVQNLELPPEFAAHKPDPIAVFRHPHLLGILSAPTRIFRWLNQRKLAEEMGSQAVGVVDGLVRPFSTYDADLAVSDEDDWPNQFKTKGLEKNSEWMREFKVDERIGKQLEVYTVAERPETERPETERPETEKQ